MSTMSQLGEFLATIQNNQDVRTAELEQRLAQLEAKDECGCAETITALEERLATLEAKDECGCAETITALEQRLAELEAKEECGCAETITALEERLAAIESKDECGCGSYDELLASYEQRISALEGNTGGGTEGEGGDSGSTEGEGGEDNGGSTEPIPASQALEKYNHLWGFRTNSYGEIGIVFMSADDHKYYKEGYCNSVGSQDYSVTSLLGANEGDIVKVYTPDLQEIEIIADTTQPYRMNMSGLFTAAFGNKVTKEVYCYDIDSANRSISLCTDEAFIAQYGNSTALGL